MDKATAQLAAIGAMINGPYSPGFRAEPRYVEPQRKHKALPGKKKKRKAVQAARRKNR